MIKNGKSVRYVYCPDEFNSCIYVPAEMYYSCLNGNWDSDLDNIFGEKYNLNVNNTDSLQTSTINEIDWVPEVNIGRIPARTVEQLRNYLNKILDNDLVNYDLSKLQSLEIYCKVNRILGDSIVKSTVLSIYQEMNYQPLIL